MGDDPAADGVTLTDAAGTELKLEEVQKFPPPWNGCGESLIFYRPAKPLTQGGAFRLTLTGPQAKLAVGFRTGTQLTQPEASVLAQISYLSIGTTSQCTGPLCTDVAQLSVELAEARAQPLWLVIRSSAHENNSNGWMFRPNAQLDNAVQLAVDVSQADRCVDIQLVGIAGQPLFEERRCTPDRCAFFDGTAPALRCPGPGYNGVDAARIPANNCDDPQVLENIEFAMDNFGAEPVSPPAACTIDQHSTRALPAWTVMLLLPALLLARPKRIRRDVARARVLRA